MNANIDEEFQVASNTQLMNMISEIDEIQEMKILFRCTLRNSKIKIMSTFVCNVFKYICTPLGFFGDVVLGCGLGYTWTTNEFRSLSYIITTELTEDEKNKLAKPLRKLLTEKNIRTLSDLNDNQAVIGSIVHGIETYLRELNNNELMFTV